MNMLTDLKLAALSVALAASVGTVHGAPCIAGDKVGSPGNTMTSDVTYGVNGPGVTTTDATKCSSTWDGNITSSGGGNSYGPSDVNDLLSIAGSDFVGGVEDGSSADITLFGKKITFTLSDETPGGDVKSGDYLLTATATDLFPPSIFLDFAVALKASPGFGLWFFDDAEFDGSGGGAWKITFLNNGSQIPGISHMEVFVREGSSGSTGTTGTTGTTGSTGTVPEPGSGSLVLVALGLLGAAFWKRRTGATLA